MEKAEGPKRESNGQHEGWIEGQLKDKFDKEQNLSFDWGGHLEYAMARNSGR